MADTSKQDSTEHHSPFSSVPIEISISVGSARPLIRDLIEMGPDSVLELDRKVEDPVELYVGDKLIARGLLEENAENGQLSVRLTDIADFKSSIS